MKKINFNIAIEISSNSDEWCNVSKPLFSLQDRHWSMDGQRTHYADDFDKIALALEDDAVALANTVTVDQLNELAKKASDDGWANIELASKDYDDGFFSASIVVEALADE